MIPRLIISLGILVSGLAEAVTYQFNLGGQDFSNRMINIQQLMYQYYPGVQLPYNSILRQVVVQAKGWDQTSSAELYLDGRFADSKVLMGRSQDFYLNDYRTFFNLSLINTLRTSAGNIDLNFRGAARVLSLTVDFVDFAPPPPPQPMPPPQPYPPQPYPPQPYPPQPRLQFVDIGSEQTQKFVSTTKTFTPAYWGDFVNQIIITGLVEKVDVERVLVIFADGSARDLPELVRRVNVGQQIGAYVGNRQIKEIQIQSRSGNFSGSRGEYKVTLGILR